MDTIIVTPRSLSAAEGHPALARLTGAGYRLVFPSPGVQPTRAQLEACIGDAVGYLAGVERIDAGLLGKAKRLRAISRNGAGVDAVDLAAAAELGIEVCRADGANARGVAELAFCLMIAAERRLPAAEAAMKACGWKREKGAELEGKVLGLLGCGRIGKLVARFGLAFGMKVLAYDAYPDKAFSPSGDFSFVAQEEAIAAADILSLHCPPLKDGRALLGRAQIASMKRGAILVNTARESLVDEAALSGALDSGAVAAYAIDAFDREPPEDWALVRHPRVIATPHLGGYTDESVDRATEAAVNNLLVALGSPKA